MSHWNPVTHNFVVRWGEFTLTLEDMVLMKLLIRVSKFFNPTALSDDSQAIVTTFRKALVDCEQVGSCYNKNGNILNNPKGFVAGPISLFTLPFICPSHILTRCR